VEQPPSDFDEEDAYSWCLWALDHGLPNLPENVQKGEAVPIARWAGPKLAAVLRVEWSWSDDPRGEPDYLASVVQAFRRTEDEWEGANGDGGGTWPDPPFILPVIGPREVRVWGTHGVVGGGWSCSAHWGRVGPEIAYAEVVVEDDTIRRTIDSPIGAMIVAFDPSIPSTVRYLTQDGEVAHVLTNPA
jgi:hypothetical protein